MNHPLISIIIPVYNGEKYLPATLDSILSQRESEWCEIILVNDGSTDNSLKLMEQYASRHAGIKIIDKENQGVSATRNRGIQEALGEYMWFIDGDDLLHPEALKIITQTLKEKKPDILSWRYATFYSRPHFAIHSDKAITRVDNSTHQAFNEEVKEGCGTGIYCKTIKRSLIQGRISFNEDMTFGEDMFFSWKCYLSAATINHIPTPLYYYRQTSNSAVSKFHPGLFEHYAKAIDDVRAFMEEAGILSAKLQQDIAYHLTCRLPSLALMETKAPYSTVEKRSHFTKVLADDRIQAALHQDHRLTGDIFNLARQGDIKTILKKAVKGHIRNRLLFPLKKLLK